MATTEGYTPKVSRGLRILPPAGTDSTTTAAASVEVEALKVYIKVMEEWWRVFYTNYHQVGGGLFTCKITGTLIISLSFS